MTPVSLLVHITLTKAMSLPLVGSLNPKSLTSCPRLLTSRKLESGSRLVMVLSVNKRADRQINYGTGGAVNEESVEDAGAPVRIRWYSDSYIDVPVRR